MQRWLGSFVLLLAASNGYADVLALSRQDDGYLLPLRGRATLSGTVLAAGCTIALDTPSQSLDLDPRPLDNRQRSLIYHLSIRFDHCALPGQNSGYGEDKAIKINFKNKSASGNIFIIKDADNKTLKSGEDHPINYRKAEQNSAHPATADYRVELTPKAPPYYAILGLNMRYE
ncbi:hypothetical protein ACWA06_06230 [Serratia rhizosphaerae]|uniref:hypothetical protein n=1 Tax=unclassified Serratia (in: enterobacteria) TaxID=2647522 RepID=UPI000CF6701F|nr:MULTISPECIES: hypothetical protein [unclassified Serratia (in: enterobacteria)]MBU3893353.1 hypothetical protein [Serratia rubidaea]AVJ19304.1 hypothetical protein CLM71_20275 [Serratia sp. MYb239]QPT13372.1 hypothetical protein I6G37_23515 [Serratia rubidaea]CAE1150218.1 conserved exported protein of unknown function [Serratia sp. Tan611]SQJ07819.1 Uncharacterised protein [Serratia rubidaea]